MDNYDLFIISLCLARKHTPTFTLTKKGERVTGGERESSNYRNPDCERVPVGVGWDGVGGIDSQWPVHKVT